MLVILRWGGFEGHCRMTINAEEPVEWVFYTARREEIEEGW